MIAAVGAKEFLAVVAVETITFVVFQDLQHFRQRFTFAFQIPDHLVGAKVLAQVVLDSKISAQGSV